MSEQEAAGERARYAKRAARLARRREQTRARALKRLPGEDWRRRLRSPAFTARRERLAPLEVWMRMRMIGWAPPVREALLRLGRADVRRSYLYQLRDGAVPIPDGFIEALCGVLRVESQHVPGLRVDAACGGRERRMTRSVTHRTSLAQTESQRQSQGQGHRSLSQTWTVA
jgi:hypothetical protein